MMKRIVAFLFFAGLIALAVVMVVPNFIDWNNHKDRVIAIIQPHLTRKIEVAGALHLQILPNPKMTLEDVTIANAGGATSPYLAKLKTLEATVRLEPLLNGEVVIDSIHLAGADMYVEVMPDGKNNWTGILQDRPRPAALGRDNVLLNRVTLADGALHYANPATGAAWETTHMNFAIEATALNGPYHAIGDLNYRGVTSHIDLQTGAYQPGQPFQLDLAMTPVEQLPKITFTGTAQPDKSFDLQGDLGLSQGRIASLFDNEFIKGVPFLNEIADLKAKIDAQNGAVSFSKIDGTFEKSSKITGSVTSTAAAAPVIKADLRMEGPVDLDAWLAGNWLARGTLDLHLSAGKLHWRGMDIFDAGLALQSADGIVDVPGVKGRMLDGVLDAKVDKNNLTGTLTGANLNTLVTLMGLDGFSFGDKSDVAFNLTEDNSQAEMFKNLSGDFQVKAGKLTVDHFNLSGLESALASAPDDAAAVKKSIQAKSTDYSDVSASFKIANGKIGFDKLALSDAAAKITASGALDLSPMTYDIAASVSPKKPDGAPDFKASATGAVKDPAALTLDAKKLLAWAKDKFHAAPPPPDKPPAKLETEKPEEDPAPAEDKSKSIQDILNRLDEESPTVPEAPPQPQPEVETAPDAPPVTEPVPLHPAMPGDDAAAPGTLMDDAEMLPDESQ